MQKNTQNNALKPKQRAAITALLSAKTNAEAARLAGCSERQLYVWLKEPIFKAELLGAESMVRNAANRQLTNRAVGALDVIAEIMTSAAMPAALRLQAAKAWLDFFYKARGEEDVDARITALVRVYIPDNGRGDGNSQIQNED
ncbi:MAG: hypothetical protein WA110_03140 [Anaerolineaceae bacterium]